MRRPSVLWWLLLGCIFAAGLAVRLYDLADPPLDFHPTRQIHAALIARGMYYQNNPAVPEWQRDMAVAQWQMEGHIEPQVFERVTAWSYALAGRPDLRIPRLVSIATWMVGAVFLVLAARALIGWGGALAAAVFFLAWPYGVIASRAFQPDPILVTLILAAMWAALQWEQRGTWPWALAAGLLAGAAIFAKSVGVFFVAPVLAVLVFARHGNRLRAILRDPQAWVLAALAVLPYAAYHVSGVYIRGDLAGQFSLRFFPQMWLDPAFYLRWISNLGRVMPFQLALAALCGALLPRRPAHRAVLLALWLGYAAYGMALPHHISTHDYYHLLLFPAAAFGVGALAQAVFDAWPGNRALLRAAAALALLAALVFHGYTARTQLKRSDAAAQARMWEEIGALLGPGASVAALVDDYGVGLKYWAWINPELWQTSDELAFRAGLGDAADLPSWFAEQAAGKQFFLVTALEELDRQPELRALLEQQYPLYRQTETYVIFDLRDP